MLRQRVYDYIDELLGNSITFEECTTYVKNAFHLSTNEAEKYIKDYQTQGEISKTDKRYKTNQ